MKPLTLRELYEVPVAEDDWPRRATPADFESYAKRPLLHIEVFAALAAGLVPRQKLLGWPRDQDPPCQVPNAPGEVEWGTRPRPPEDPDAVNWGVPFNKGMVGYPIRLWLETHPSLDRIPPRELLKFFEKHEIPVNPEFSRWVTVLTGKKSADESNKGLYLARTLAVAQRLKAKGEPSRSMRAEAIHNEVFFHPDDESLPPPPRKRIAPRTFRDYLGEWAPDHSAIRYLWRRERGAPELGDG